MIKKMTPRQFWVSFEKECSRARKSVSTPVLRWSLDYPPSHVTVDYKNPTEVIYSDQLPVDIAIVGRNDMIRGFCKINTFRAVSLPQIEKAVLFLTTRRRFKDYKVSFGRYDFDFSKLDVLTLRYLLDVILSSDKTDRVNFSWVAPLQALYFTELDKFESKKIKKKATRRVSRTEDSLIDPPKQGNTIQDYNDKIYSMKFSDKTVIVDFADTNNTNPITI